MHQLLMKKASSKHMPVALILWVVFFCYAISAALIFQKLLLPIIPSMHAADGLLPNDSAYFDSVATNLAEQIRLHGWGAWRLYPTASASGNVAILGVLYRVFGHDPALMIPVNAAAHALGGLCIYLIVRELSVKSRISVYAGIIAATLFVIFPSALNWYGQIHKDGYAIAGTLLVLLTWLKAVNGPPDIRAWLLLVLANMAGILLVASVRPYNLTFFLLATLGALVLQVAVYTLKHQFLVRVKTLMFFVVSLVLIVGTINVVGSLRVISPEGGTASVGEADSYYKNWHSEKGWAWKNSSWVPDRIEDYILAASTVRRGLIEYGQSINAKSLIDEDITPQSVNEVIQYLPRALQVAAFAPFPDRWLTNLSLTRLVAVGEMAIYYVCFPGIFLLLFYNRRQAVWISIYFACFFLLIYGFTIANLGSLYRLRYAYIFIFLALGVLGWFTWLDNTGRLNKILRWLKPPAEAGTPPADDPPVGANHGQMRKEVVGSGFIVMVLTLLSFGGFFLRDIMMAHKFGLGTMLDNFFVALLIPMFIVTVLSMPLGTAFIPFYLDAKERLLPKAAKTLITGTSSWTTAGLIVICVLLYLIGPSILPYMYTKGAISDMHELNVLLDLALPLLLFSGVVILGNSVLNANGRAILTSTAQLVVPVTAILALLLFGNLYGVKAVMFGMVIGQLLNLLIVQFYLRYYDASLVPSSALHRQTGLSPLFVQYLPLASSAFFVGVAAPVATLLAMSLPEGSVAAFNLGNKVVLFVTGLVGTVIATVMLPYFSSLVAKNHLVVARRELSLFLLFATIISIPISIGLYIWSEPIVRLMFQGGTFDISATEQVSRVMKYSVIQLPFFVCNSLLLKFATATKHVLAISLVAVIGLIANIAVSIVLMGHIGVAGIAIGASVAMMVSTVFLVLVLVRYWHITYFDALIMLLSWLLFITLVICVHFQSNPSIYMTVLAFVILLMGYINSLITDTPMRNGFAN